MDKDLKPCPFCGGEAIIGHVAKNKVEIKCTKCFVKMTQRCLRHSAEWLEGKMIEKWNTRATDCPAVDVEDNTPIYEMLEHAILCLEYAKKDATHKGYSIHCHEALLTLKRLASRNLTRGAVEPIEGLEEAILSAQDFIQRSPFTCDYIHTVIEAAKKYNEMMKGI